ncbi:hypothetical protein ACFL6U_06975 [Planctomycetota bacterium]
MEATISGKYYDTETAQLIYTWNNGVYSTTDFGYRSKVLYRTSNGDWFLVQCKNVLCIRLFSVNS